MNMNTTNTKGIIRNAVTIIALALCAPQGMAQITYRIDESIAFPDLRVKISPDASFPDIAVSISKDIAFEDFTVAMTSNRSLADFIISDSQLSDISVNASATVAFADVTVKYGASVPFTNVKVKLIDYGNADYLVYTERSSVTLQEIVVAILPALNKAMHFKFGKIPVYSGDFKQPKRNMNQQGTININSADILLILKDAKIYAQDKKGTYLGKIASKYDPESICKLPQKLYSIEIDN